MRNFCCSFIRMVQHCIEIGGFIRVSVFVDVFVLLTVEIPIYF